MDTTVHNMARRAAWLLKSVRVGFLAWLIAFVLLGLATAAGWEVVRLAE